MKMKTLKFDTPKTPVDDGFEEEKIELELPEGAIESDDDDVEVSQEDLEIVDDTPEADRGRKPSAPPTDVTDEELAKYSPKAKERIQHFTKGYHDERRAREKAERERLAAEEMARVAMEQLKEMQGKLQSTHQAARSATQSQLEAKLQQAEKEYRDAYEAGDGEALSKATQDMMSTRFALEQAKATPETVEEPLQINRDEIYKRYVPEQTQPAADERALAWHADNPWYGQDREMSETAAAIHIRLIKSGVDPAKDPDSYYNALNKRLRGAFPDYEWGEEAESNTVEVEEPVRAPTPAPSRAKPASVVAPATRSTAPKKITLTASEVTVARRLGVSLEEYARNKAELQKRGQL